MNEQERVEVAADRAAGGATFEHCFLAFRRTGCGHINSLAAVKRVHPGVTLFEARTFLETRFHYDGDRGGFVVLAISTPIVTDSGCRSPHLQRKRPRAARSRSFSVRCRRSRSPRTSRPRGAWRGDRSTRPLDSWSPPTMRPRPSRETCSKSTDWTGKPSSPPSLRASESGSPVFQLEAEPRLLNEPEVSRV